jgi:hypothetical protein
MKLVWNYRHDYYRISLNIMRFFQILFLRKEGSPYFRVLKNKCGEDVYEKFVIANSNYICENTYNYTSI